MGGCLCLRHRVRAAQKQVKRDGGAAAPPFCVLSKGCDIISKDYKRRFLPTTQSTTILSQNLSQKRRRTTATRRRSFMMLSAPGRASSMVSIRAVSSDHFIWAETTRRLTTRMDASCLTIRRFRSCRRSAIFILTGASRFSFSRRVSQRFLGKMWLCE